jgi:hypothetical protein
MKKTWALTAMAAGSLLLGIVGGVSAQPNSDCGYEGRRTDGYSVYPVRWSDRDDRYRSDDRYRWDDRYRRDDRYGRYDQDDWRYRRARLNDEREDRLERERYRRERAREERYERDRDRRDRRYDRWHDRDRDWR